jgi:hypothetical protein
MNSPEETSDQTPMTDDVLLRAERPRDKEAQRRDRTARQAVEVHGTDVEPGQEMTDTPRAGTTEPPD